MIVTERGHGWYQRWMWSDIHILSAHQPVAFRMSHLAAEQKDRQTCSERLLSANWSKVKTMEDVFLWKFDCLMWICGAESRSVGGKRCFSFQRSRIVVKVTGRFPFGRHLIASYVVYLTLTNTLMAGYSQLDSFSFHCLWRRQLPWSHAAPRNHQTIGFYYFWIGRPLVAEAAYCMFSLFNKTK